MIEAALAHVVRNRVEAAYARSDLFERRRVLMDDWAAYLGREENEGRRLHGYTERLTIRRDRTLTTCHPRP